MDLIFAGCIAVPTLFGLVYDSHQRKRFNNFMKTKETGDFMLLGGNVKSDDPITYINPDTNMTTQIITKKTKTLTRHYHTVHDNKTVYSDGKLTVKIPVSNTYEVWDKLDTSRSNADSILSLGMSIYFDKNARIDWDSSTKKIINNTKICEKTLLNNRYRTFFGKMTSHDTFLVKYIGDEKFVTDKIRYNHYGVGTNWETGIAYFMLALSTGYVVNSLSNRYQK